MTLDIFTWASTIGTADRVRSVLDDVVTSIRDSEHYPAGVFDSMEAAIVPGETYFEVLNFRAAPRFTYGMAALAVTGLRLWLTTYTWTEHWPLIWVGVILDGAMIGKLEFDRRQPSRRLRLCR